MAPWRDINIGRVLEGFGDASRVFFRMAGQNWESSCNHPRTASQDASWLWDTVSCCPRMPHPNFGIPYPDVGDGISSFWGWLGWVILVHPTFVFDRPGLFLGQYWDGMKNEQDKSRRGGDDVGCVLLLSWGRAILLLSGIPISGTRPKTIPVRPQFVPGWWWDGG